MSDIQRETYVSREPLFEFSEGSPAVLVNRITTRKGKRLEFSIPDLREQIWLDALELEALTWQDQEVYASMATHHSTDVPLRTSIEGPLEDLEGEADRLITVTIANEYSVVGGWKARDGEHEVLVIMAKQAGYVTQLGYAELWGLAQQDHEVFSTFLEQPHGPEGIL